MENGKGILKIDKFSEGNGYLGELQPLECWLGCNKCLSSTQSYLSSFLINSSLVLLNSSKYAAKLAKCHLGS